MARRPCRERQLDLLRTIYILITTKKVRALLCVHGLFFYHREVRREVRICNIRNLNHKHMYFTLQLEKNVDNVVVIGDLFLSLQRTNIICNVTAMDKRTTLSREEAIGLVRQYKQVIMPRFAVEPKVMMFGSYSKGYANPDSDIDVAVIVPSYGDKKLEISKNLWHDVDKVSFLIEPILMAEDKWSPLYDDVMRTGIVV